MEKKKEIKKEEKVEKKPEPKPKVQAKVAPKEKPKVNERDVVIPGEVLAEGLGFLPSDGTYRDGDKIKASMMGLVSIKGRVIKVIPLSGRFSGKRNQSRAKPSPGYHLQRYSHSRNGGRTVWHPSYCYFA